MPQLDPQDNPSEVVESNSDKSITPEISRFGSSQGYTKSYGNFFGPRKFSIQKALIPIVSNEYEGFGF